MTERLTPLDAAFLELEEGDESAHMHIGWAMVFDPPPNGEAPSLKRLQALLAKRLQLLPRFQRRLSSPRVGRFSWPTWEPDKRFDIENHVRRASLPEPRGEAEFLEWLGDFYSHRIDRAHPLWQMTLIDSLGDGGWAIAAKVHHSLVDGISGASVATAILDAEPSPANQEAIPPEPTPSENGEVADRGLVSTLAGSARAGLSVALHPGKLGSVLSRSRSMAEVLVHDELVPAPHTSLNVRIGGTRRLSSITVPLDDLKSIKRHLGGTVNDVVLAISGGGLRRLFEHRDESELADQVRAMVPVSLRRAGELLALGNRVSSLFVELPLAEPDPLLRYHKTVAAAEELKSGDMAKGAEALVQLAGAAPPIIHGAVARLAFAPRLFNITITNVPGPQATFYSMGAPLRRVLPLVPIFAGHAVGVAAVSYDGQLTFGLNADRTRVPDLDVLRDGIEESLTELRRLADAA